MATQSEYELETQLVNQLVGMHYELVNVTDETSMKANLRKQIEIHNRLEAAPLTNSEFNRIFLHLTKGNEAISPYRHHAVTGSDRAGFWHDRWLHYLWSDAGRYG